MDVLDFTTARPNVGYSLPRRDGDAAVFHGHDTLASDPSEVGILERMLLPLLHRLRFSADDIFAIQIILCEAVTNAIGHGNGSDSSKFVTIDYAISTKRFWIRIQDEGPGFDFRCPPNPLAADTVGKIGGRGLFLIDFYANEVRYTPPGNCLEIEFRPKRRDAPA